MKFSVQNLNIVCRYIVTTFSRTTWPFPTKLNTKHLWLKGFQVFKYFKKILKSSPETISNSGDLFLVAGVRRLPCVNAWSIVHNINWVNLKQMRSVTSMG